MLSKGTLAAAFVVILAGPASAVMAATTAGPGEAQPEPRSAEAPGPKPSAQPAAPIIEDDEPSAVRVAVPERTASDSKKSSRRPRYKITKRGKSRGRVVMESELRVAPPVPPSGKLHVFSLALKDEADVNIFNEDGSYNVEALKQVDHVLRCKRTDMEHKMEPHLVTVLSHLYDHFGKRIDIVSAYRFQRKETSNHFKGSAADVRIDGVNIKAIRAFAESLDAGGMGVGIYPRSQFVHIDIRPLPSYRWVDNSRANPNSSDKRPPRGWKRKKLQS